MATSGRRRFLALAAGAGGAAALGGLLSDRPPAALRRVVRGGHALGTTVTLTVLHEDAAAAGRAADAALAEIDRVEDVMSLYRPDSQLRRLNRDGALDDPHPWLVDVLARAAGVSRRSGGAFDVTVQPLWALHAAAAKAGRTPSPGEVAAARSCVDWRRVRIGRGRVELQGEGTAVTLNGIAQGYACDRARAALAARGIRHALLDTGELAGVGSKEGGAPWTAGIQHPRRPDAWLALAALDGRFMATSGDYATSFTPDFRSNHLLDPATGRSPEELASATVLARDGAEADALSTAAAVLGARRGLALAASTPGADALFVLKGGDVIATSGFPRA